MGETDVRCELVSGVVAVSPSPLRLHQLAVVRLVSQVDAQVPYGWEVVVEFDVLVQAVEPVTVRSPDVVVVRANSPQQRAPARDVALAV